MSTLNIASNLSANKPKQFGDVIAELLTVPAQQRSSVAAERSASLTADEGQIRHFVNAIFKRCVLKDGMTFGGRISFRAFRNRDAKPILHGEWEPLVGKPIARAAQLATRIARRPPEEAAVFAPPVCLFNDSGRARAADVLACPAIAIEIDAAPMAGRQALEALLGPATVVVASGGRWASPEGASEDKLHLYWRLRAPAVSNDEQALLYAVRDAAAVLIGADKTGVPLSHPMRWPGSWHTKGEPRLCRIIDGDEAAEIDLSDAAARLNVDPEKARQRRKGVRPDGQSFTTQMPWTREQLLDAAAHLPNPDLPWDDWNMVAMAFYDASHASDDGFDGFDIVSQKSKLYDADATAARYDHFSSSPPDRISGAWLVRRIRETTDPLYCKLSVSLGDEGRAELAGIWTANEEARQRREAEEARPRPASGLRVVSGVIAPSNIPVREWLLDPLLPLGDAIQCIGEPGIGKSSLMLLIALGVATGRQDILRGKNAAGQPISPVRLHRPGPVLIYNAEDRLAEMERRLAAAQRHFGVTDADMKHDIVLWSGVDNDHLTLLSRADGRSPLKLAPGFAQLEAVIRSHGAVMVALDPQRSLTGGVENSTEDAEALFQALARLAADTRSSIVVVHHPNKSTRENAGDMMAGSGSSAAAGKVRSSFTATNVRPDARRADEKDWNLGGPNAHLIRIDHGKLNHGEKLRAPLVYRRLSVPVGNGAGVRPEAAAALFDQDPRAALEMAGDMAPVLELVDIATLTAQDGSKGPPAHAEAVARIVSEIMGDRNEDPWNAILDTVSNRLRAERVTTATTRQFITGMVTDALCHGIEIEQGGQAVLITAKRRGSQARAPWFIEKIRRVAEAK